MRREDVRRRRRLPGEQAVALLFMDLFQDAQWFAHGGRFPDGLPPYAHSPQYLTLFAMVYDTIQRKRSADEKRAAFEQAALARAGRK